MNSINVSLLQNFYKIIGVLIDNAIEAVESYDKKEISIEIYIEDNYFVFEIANEFYEQIDFEKLGKTRFTTKGESHGYGLLLVKEIVNNNEEIYNQTEIVSNLFIQKVGIKIKG